MTRAQSPKEAEKDGTCPDYGEQQPLNYSVSWKHFQPHNAKMVFGDMERFWILGGQDCHSPEAMMGMERLNWIDLI